MGKALIIKGADFSQVAVDTVEIVVGQPTISIDLFGNVTIASPNGEDIYYTIDGSTPTNQSTKYTGSFNVQPNTTVKAVCYFGGNYSDVVSQLYDGTLQAPTIAIATNGMVTITATDNATIRYTTDGSEPTSASGNVYASPFKVADGVTVKAIAYLASGSSTIVSSVSSETASVYEWIFGKGLGSVTGTQYTIVDVQDAALSPKVYFDAGTDLKFYFNGTNNEYNRLGEFDANDQLLTWWNGQFTPPRTISSSGLESNTAYVRFSTKVDQDYIGKNGVECTKNGEPFSLFYNGETDDNETES